MWGDEHGGPRGDGEVLGSEHGDHILLHKLRGNGVILIIVEDLLIRDVRGSGIRITGQAKLRMGWVSIRAVGCGTWKGGDQSGRGVEPGREVIRAVGVWNLGGR